MKKNTKILSLFLTLVLMISSLTLMLPANATEEDQTVDTYWTDYTEPFTVGSGGSDAPYEIDTAGKLAYLASVINNPETYSNYRNKYYKLTADIDLSGHLWRSIGINHKTDAFLGKLDGNGKTISNMTFGKQLDYGAGLFGCLLDGAKVYNLTIQGTISSPEKYGVNNGSIPGFGVLATAAYNSQIYDCNFYTKVEMLNMTKSNVTDNPWVGGVVGYVYNSYFTNCNAYGSVTFTADETVHGYAGGFAGRIRNGGFKDCNNYVNVSVTMPGEGHHVAAGGITGAIRSDAEQEKISIENCINYANITAAGSENSLYAAGGIVGMTGLHSEYKSVVTITNCANMGTVSGIGLSEGSGANGLVGVDKCFSNTYSNCFTTTATVTTQADENVNVAGLRTCVTDIALDTIAGARVRMNLTKDGASSLRFDSKIDAELYETLTALEGVTVTLGTVIAPTENIEAVADSYDKISALQEIGWTAYLNVGYDASKGWFNEDYQNKSDYDENAQYFGCVSAKIYSNSFNTEYSAIGFVTVTIGDWSATFYADDGVENGEISADRVRSVAQVGTLACADTAFATKYTEAQQDALEAFKDAVSAN